MRRKRQQQQALGTQRHCGFCIHQVKALDYKDPGKLRRYTSSYGKIVPRRRSGVCAKHQRMLAQAIKRARFMSLLPYVVR
jgi:small subunit ribosomal protein S18